MGYNPDQERDERGRFGPGGKTGGELRRASGSALNQAVREHARSTARANAARAMRLKAAEDYGRSRYGMGRGAPGYSREPRSFARDKPGIFRNGRREGRGGTIKVGR